MKALVVGAGLSGATLARCLAEKGHEVQVIDKECDIGGMCADGTFGDIYVQKYGTHVFHTDDEGVWAFINRFGRMIPYEHKVVASVEGHLVPVPFNFDSIEACFPRILAERIEKALLRKYPVGKDIPITTLMASDDEDLQMLGHYIYDHIYKGYTEKQWATRIENLEGMEMRVPVRASRDDRYFKDKYQAIPRTGYSEIIFRMLDCNGIETTLGESFDPAVSSDYDEVFCSAPIDDYAGVVLPYRTLHFENERMPCEDFQNHAVVNYPNGQGFTRIHEFKHLKPYSFYLTKETIVSEEFPGGLNDIKSYPIPTQEASRKYERAVRKLRERYPNIHPFGRLGGYKYINMDKAIRLAINLANEF